MSHYRGLKVWAVEMVRTGEGPVNLGTVVAEDMSEAMRRAATWALSTVESARVEFVRSLADVDRLTKWDLLNDRERAELDRTGFGKSCSGCGEFLVTEADYARHFTLTSVWYRNLGECPRPVES